MDVIEAKPRECSKKEIKVKGIESDIRLKSIHHIFCVCV